MITYGALELRGVVTIGETDKGVGWEVQEMMTNLFWFRVLFREVLLVDKMGDVVYNSGTLVVGGRRGRVRCFGIWLLE